MRRAPGRSIHRTLPFLLVALLCSLGPVPGCNRVEVREESAAPAPGEPTPAGRFEPRVVPTPRARIAAVTGTDGQGYPLATVDKLELLRWLREGRYEALEEALAFYQDAFAADFHHELWARDSLSAFASADPSLTEALAAWSEARPRSWQAALARAEHAYARARRAAAGGQGGTAAAVGLLRDAWNEVQLALVLRGDLAMAHLLAARIAQATGDAAAKLEAFQRAARLAPRSYLVWRAFVWGTAPRLGGSHATMQAIARQAGDHLEANPRLALLEGAVAADRARTLARAGDLASALEHYGRALEAGHDPELLAERGRLHLRAGRPADALEDLDASLARRPQDPETLAARARALLRLGESERARADAALAARLDPACGCLLDLGPA